MKLTVKVWTDPQSFDAEDEIGNALQGKGLRQELERELGEMIEVWMGWANISVKVKLEEA